MPPKRSAAASKPATKRTKLDPIVAAGRALLTRYESYDFSGTDSETLTGLECHDLVRYAVYLQNLVDEQSRLKDSLAVKGNKELTKQEIWDESVKLRTKIDRGITKQLTWKASCKTGSASFSFDGTCPVPAVMARFLGLEKPEDVKKFKVKKFTLEEFRNIMGGVVSGSARYDELLIVGPTVNLRWNAETGEYKWTGKYGTYTAKYTLEEAATKKATTSDV